MIFAILTPNRLIKKLEFTVLESWNRRLLSIHSGMSLRSGCSVHIMWWKGNDGTFCFRCRLSYCTIIGVLNCVVSDFYLKLSFSSRNSLKIHENPSKSCRFPLIFRLFLNIFASFRVRSPENSWFPKYSKFPLNFRENFVKILINFKIAKFH